jgi:hypothetical protein
MAAATENCRRGVRRPRPCRRAPAGPCTLTRTYRAAAIDRCAVLEPELSRSQGRRPLAANCECPKWVCAVTRRRFPVGASPTRQPLQPEAIGAVMEETKWLKPSISVSRIGDSASVQAATRVNAEQASKRTMRRPTRQPFRGRLIRLDGMSETDAQSLRRGSGDSMYTRKAYATREASRRGQG